MIKKGMPELLAPAGTMEKLEVALFYGADAVYLGGKSLNLRSASSGFDRDDLLIATQKAHSVGAKVYYCVNSILHDEHIDELEKTIDELQDIPVDALIIADAGVLSLVKKRMPNMEIHLSTQANTVNRLAIEFWRDMGVHRVNLARELNRTEIEDIRKKVTAMELEVFVHGAMCMAVSGQCFLSKWVNDRDANLGECSQPCRFSYSADGEIEEVHEDYTEQEEVEVPLFEQRRTKEGEAFPMWYVREEGEYSSLLASEDLCLVEYIPWFVEQNIHSIKIEGRMKSIAYLAYAVNAYRWALQDIAKGMYEPEKYTAMLYNHASRPLSTGFFLPDGRKIIPKPAQEKAKSIVARVEEKLGEGMYHVSVRQPWNATKEVVPFYPQKHSAPLQSYTLEDTKGEKKESVHPGMHHIMHCEEELPVGILLQQ